MAVGGFHRLLESAIGLPSMEAHACPPSWFILRTTILDK